MIEGEEVEAAMARHPTAWRPKPHLLRLRMAELLRAEGAEHAEVASWALAARGSLGLDRREFAALFDLDERRIEEVEAGDVAAVDLPRLLRLALVECDRPSGAHPPCRSR